MTQEREITLHIGFDDTDSLKGSCTTHLATKIIEEISNRVTFLDYPRLIRNNPNVPWKTRGNGAIGLAIKTDEGEKTFVYRMLHRAVCDSSEFRPAGTCNQSRTPVQVG